MKKLVLIGLSFFFLSACKKAVEEKKEDIILDAMTNGQWYIFSYKEEEEDLSSLYTAYTFQFYRDGKLSAFTTNTEDKGSWIADVNALSITTDFPTAESPINKLNAVWKITDNSWDYVKASATVNDQDKFLHLKKK